MLYSRCFTELVKVLGVECQNHPADTSIWRKPPRAGTFPIKIPNFTKIEATTEESLMSGEKNNEYSDMTDMLLEKQKLFKM